MNTISTVKDRPKVTKRAANDRGNSELGWLHSRHTFSFGNYFDPAHMGFRSLRVINDDVVESSQGFGQHPHRDAEIFSYVISGELEHRDSMGNGRIIRAGDLQYMSAGRGVMHSEFNPLPDRPVHFLQVWLKPRMTGGEPRYAEMPLGKLADENSLTRVLSSKPSPGSIETRADAEVYFGKLNAGKQTVFQTTPGSAQWLHMIAGELHIAGETFGPGDGGSFEHFDTLPIEAAEDSQFLWFELH